MSLRAVEALQQYLRRLCDEAVPTEDAVLLKRFVAAKDRSAFETLIARHGPMVLGTARRLVGNTHDAEDVFQAVFLSLARLARTIRQGQTLPAWLYKATCRIAARIRANHPVPPVPPPEPYEQGDPGEGLVRQEIRQALDQELQRLPERLRSPLLLCYLSELTRDEAAKQLGWSLGTLKRRLGEGRNALRIRLERRGIGAVGLALTVLAPEVLRAVVSKSLVESSLNLIFSTGTVVPATISSLVLSSATPTKGLAMKLILALLAASAVGVGASVLAQLQTTPEKDAATTEPDRPRATADKKGNPDKVQADAREMRGTWTMTAIEVASRNGESLPPREKKVTHIIADGKLTTLGDDGLINGEWSIALDPTRKPKAIDLASPQLGTLSGIYQLDGETLKIYFSAEAGKRPTEFPARANPDLSWNLKRVSRTPTKAVPRFANDPGCFWMVEPTPPPNSMATLGIVFVYEKDRDGAALITLAGAVPGSRRPEYRPVLLDAGKKRYLPEPIPGGGYSGTRDGIGVALSRWRMDPKTLPAEKVALIGIEALTPAFHRAAARAALEQAQKEGMEVLPYPELGKPFDFTLTTTEGKKIRSQDLRGKVVVIDCWATWCVPCMTLLPEVNELYRKRHKDGLEVIGLSLDNDAEKVKKTCQRLALGWPQAMAPSEEKKRAQWQKASGISSIPRVLVIDREGILRADSPTNLDQEVSKLLKAASRK